MQVVLYWLKERLRDAWLWPLNLVRDFPARSGRLVQTLFVAGKAPLTVPLFILEAIKTRTVQQQVRPGIRQTGIWLHLFLVQLFDLVGGPEVCQFIMHLGMHTTPLTPEEETVVQALFGSNNLRYKEVRVAEGGILNLIFRYNGQLAFATWYTVHLPHVEDDVTGTAVSGRKHLPLLIHELTHIFQYHHVGTRYLGEAIYYLITTHRDCYQYGGSAGLHLCWQQGQNPPPI